MVCRLQSLVWNVLLVELDIMLHKLTIMFSIIRHMKMIFNQHPGILIIWVIIGVKTVWNMNQYRNLVGVPIHWLHFILNLECKVFYKINYKNYAIIWERLHTNFKFLVLASSNKIVLNKMLELGFEILNKFISTNVFVN